MYRIVSKCQCSEVNKVCLWLHLFTSYLGELLAVMKALKRISSFSGEGDVERWIDRFQLAVEIDEKTDKEAQLLSLYLTGPAYDTWKGLAESEKKDARKIKDALRTVYGLRRQDAWHEALSRKIAIGENVDVAGEEISKNLNVAVKGDDPLEYVKGLILLDALPKNIREQVMMNIGDDSKYSHVLQATKKVWPHSKEVENFGLIGRTDANPGQQKVVKCFCCNRFGHSRKECRIHCFRCGKQGHRVSQCTAVPLNGMSGAAQEPAVPEIGKIQQL